MAVIKVVEDYAVSQLRKDVRDSMSLAGEQSVLLQLYHPGDPDAKACPQCNDTIYKSPEVDCNSCYGTMFDGGVRKAMKVWALYTDHDLAEQLSPRGTWQPDERAVTFEAFPMVTEHDVLVRIRRWNTDGTPLELEGFYRLQKIKRRSLRTGNRFGQWSWDVVSQQTQISEVSSSSDKICQYPILGKPFSESVQLTPVSPTTPAKAVVEPDTKVIYFPFETAPGGVAPETGSPSGAAFVWPQVTPAATWIIHHNLGYNPSVSVIVNGEEVEPDVDYPDTNTVTLIFSTPQAGTARLT